MPRATRRHPAVLPPKSGLTWSDAERRAARSQEVSAGCNSLPRQRRQDRPSCPAEARAWNCAVSASADIAAHSRFQTIKQVAVRGGPSFFTTRDSFLANGNFGQFILGLPAVDMVMVHRRAVTDQFAIARNLGKTDASPAGVAFGADDFLAIADMVLATRP